MKELKESLASGASLDAAAVAIASSSGDDLEVGPDIDGFILLRDWSLITGRRGLQNWRGGAREVLPLTKRGGGKSFSHAEGGTKKVLG